MPAKAASDYRRLLQDAELNLSTLQRQLLDTGLTCGSPPTDVLSIASDTALLNARREFEQEWLPPRITIRNAINNFCIPQQISLTLFIWESTEGAGGGGSSKKAAGFVARNPPRCVRCCSFKKFNKHAGDAPSALSREGTQTRT